MLIVIRGNSGAGKSSVAREVRARYGRGCALVEQDHLRRIVLREHDSPAGAASDVIEATTRAALAGGYHVVLEGILHTEIYAPMLHRLIATEPSHVYYLDVTFAESVRRHGTRAQSTDFTPDQMRDWYTPHDLLAVPGEHLIPESSTFARTVDSILTTSGLLSAEPVAPCPARCPRCRPRQDDAAGSSR